MPLSERERAIAIKEAHNIAASEAYFEVRASVVHPQPHTIFDAGFSRGWDAATAPLLAQIAALEVQLAEARKDAERYRWLKNGCNDKGTTATHIAKDLFGFEWNRSIDAAIAQEQPNTKVSGAPAPK